MSDHYDRALVEELVELIWLTDAHHDIVRDILDRLVELGWGPPGECAARRNR